MQLGDECRVTLTELGNVAAEDNGVREELENDDRALREAAWIRLRNGSYVRGSAVTEIALEVRSTFYFAAYRQLCDDPAMIESIKKYLEPEDGNQ